MPQGAHSRAVVRIKGIIFTKHLAQRRHVVSASWMFAAVAIVVIILIVITWGDSFPVSIPPQPISH